MLLRAGAPRRIATDPPRLGRLISPVTMRTICQGPGANVGSPDKASTPFRAGSAGARRKDARIRKDGRVYCCEAWRDVIHPRGRASVNRRPGSLPVCTGSVARLRAAGQDHSHDEAGRYGVRCRQ